MFYLLVVIAYSSSLNISECVGFDYYAICSYQSVCPFVDEIVEHLHYVYFATFICNLQLVLIKEREEVL